MSTESNKAIVRRYIEEVLNQGNLAAVDELLDPNFVIRHAGIPEPVRGTEHFKQFIQTQESPGLLLVHSLRPIGSVIEGLLLVWTTWTEEDLHNSARWLP